MEDASKKRTDPPDLPVGISILRKENRRNKITPRFSKRKVLLDSGVTLRTIRKQKLHKQKIRKTTLQTDNS